MYNVTRKEEAVRELQHYLSEAGSQYVAPSGVYDERTRESVIEFQKESGLSATGITDSKTFAEIYAAYARKISRGLARRKAGREVKFPIKFGDSGSEIYRINGILSRLAMYYREMHAIGNTAYFGRESARITVRLREIFGMPPSEQIDEELYLRLFREEDAIEKTSPFGFE